MLRPFGYALQGVVWTVIWLAALAIYPGSMLYVAVDDPAAVVRNMSEMLSSPVQATVLVVVLVPLVAVVMGPAALWLLPTASWPLMVLSWVYVGRSLRPDHRSERLSRTTWARPGEAFGPPTVTSVAMSLQPVRRSRLTDVLMRFYAAGWNPDGRMFLAMLPAGLAWVAGVVALLDGVPPAARWTAGAVAAALLATSAVLGVRAFRARFAPRVTPADGVARWSPEERRDRLAQLRRAQASRRRGSDAGR
ncbi:hypothetical protein [Isoptericola aurantiacus]|uniref:hypothetical protein n=1 Tax=Isoptericola aurantiacus TaxID=3377839 RepID=UPI00383BF589